MLGKNIRAIIENEEFMARVRDIAAQGVPGYHRGLRDLVKSYMDLNGPGDVTKVRAVMDAVDLFVDIDLKDNQLIVVSTPNQQNLKAVEQNLSAAFGGGSNFTDKMLDAHANTLTDRIFDDESEEIASDKPELPPLPDTVGPVPLKPQSTSAPAAAAVTPPVAPARSPATSVPAAKVATPVSRATTALPPLPKATDAAIAAVTLKNIASILDKKSMGTIGSDWKDQLSKNVASLVKLYPREKIASAFGLHPDQQKALYAVHDLHKALKNDARFQGVFAISRFTEARVVKELVKMKDDSIKSVLKDFEAKSLGAPKKGGP